jgi:hypothetical protein
MKLIKNHVKVENNFTAKTVQHTKDAVNSKNRLCFICTKSHRNCIGLHRNHY